jgi:hypothetical protein
MIAAAPDIESTILSRVIAPDEGTLSVEGASALLSLKFSEEDQQRMRELAEKARRGELTGEDAAWTTAYERVGSLLGLLQSKARQTIKRHTDATK